MLQGYPGQLFGVVGVTGLDRLAFFFENGQTVAGLGQTLVPFPEPGIGFLAGGFETFDFPCPGDHAPVLVAFRPDANPVRTQPDAVPGHDALTRAKRRAVRQGIVDRVRREHPIEERTHRVVHEGGERRQCPFRGRCRPGFVERHPAAFQAREIVRQRGGVVDRDGVGEVAQNRLDGRLPTRRNPETLAEPRCIVQTVFAKPAGGLRPVRRFADGRPLHRQKTGQLAPQSLRLAPGIVAGAFLTRAFLASIGKRLGIGGEVRPKRIDPTGRILDLPRQAFDPGIHHAAGFGLQCAGPGAQALQHLLPVFDSALLDLGFAIGVADPGGMVLAGALAATYPFLDIRKPGGGRPVIRLAVRQPGRLGGEFRVEFLDASRVRVELFLGVPVPRCQTLEIPLVLRQSLGVVFDALFQTRGIGTGTVPAALHCAQLGVQFSLRGAVAVERRVEVRALCKGAFVFGLQRADVRLLAGQLGADRPEPQGVQLCREATLVLLELAVPFGGPCLAFEVREVATEFVGPLGEPLQVFDRVLDAILGLPPPLAILGDARRFLEIGPEFVGLGHHHLRDHALFDDRVAAGSDAGPQEDIGHVPASAARAVQVVGGLGVTGEFPTNGDLRVGGEPALGEFAAGATVAIVEDQFDGCQGSGLADLGADEDDVGERFAAQLPRRTLAENPAHRIDDVGLAAAVRTHHRTAVAREGDRRRIDE